MKVIRMSWDRILIWGICVVLLVVTIVILYQNRGLDQLSDKILPSIIIGLISFVGLIWVSPEIKDKSIEIPVVFFYKKDSYEPFDFFDLKLNSKDNSDVVKGAMPRWPMNNDGYELIPRRVVSEAKSRKMNIGQVDDTSKEIVFYQNMLEYLVVSNFTDKFARSWQVNWRQNDWSYLTRSVGSATEISPIDNDCNNVINHQDILSKFAQNKLFEIVLGSDKFEFCVPPNTTFQTSDPSSGEKWMLFDNSFVTLKIEILPNDLNIGWGLLGEFIGVEFNNVYQSAYKIKYSAKFKKLKQNHPDMKHYEHWAQKVLDSLEEFNHDEYWKRMERWQLLRSSLNN